MSRIHTVISTVITCIFAYVGFTNEGYLAQAMLIIVGWNTYGIIRHSIQGE
jgi:hypothetical protein